MADNKQGTAPLVDDFIIFKMIRLINFLGRDAESDVLKQHKLSIKEWRIMIVIAAHPDASAKDIAHLSGYSEMAISRMGKSLVRKDLIRTLQGEGDRRKYCFQLTGKGQELYEEIYPKVADLESDLLGVLSGNEQQVLRKVIDKLISSVIR